MREAGSTLKRTLADLLGVGGTSPTPRSDIPQSDPEATPVPPPSSPYLAAAEDIRTAARWLLTAFAAVGGALIAGVPLTAVGRTAPFSGSFFWAAGGVAAALTAIAYMIFLVSRVCTSEFISFAEFTRIGVPGVTGERRRSRIRAIAESAERSRFELYGHEARDLGELRERLEEVNDQLREASTRPDKPVPTVLASRAASVTAAAARVTDFANYEYVRRIFERSFRDLRWPARWLPWVSAFTCFRRAKRLHKGQLLQNRLLFGST